MEKTLKYYDQRRHFRLEDNAHIVEGIVYVNNSLKVEQVEDGFVCRKEEDGKNIKIGRFMVFCKTEGDSISILDPDPSEFGNVYQLVTELMPILKADLEPVED